MGYGILCQGCGIEAPSKQVEFHQNIGALVVRFGKSYRGHMCKRCLHKYFWQATLTTLFLGPWGVISLILTPIFLLNNITRYLMALSMPAVPPDARVPVLDQAAVERLNPHAQEILTRLNRQEPLADVATSIARLAAVTPGQVVLFVAALARRLNPSQPPTGGFPVISRPSTQPPAPRPSPIESLEDRVQL